MIRVRTGARALVAAALLVGCIAVTPAGATTTTPTFRVYTGYADCPVANPGCSGTKVTNPAFPKPWVGATNYQFVADPNEIDPLNNSDPDTSAIRIQNNGTKTLTINDVSVTGCASGLDLWGTSPYAYPYTVAAGHQIVFSSTAGDNFDGSEICSTDPTVNVNIGGVVFSYPDNIALGGRGAIVGGPCSCDESVPWTKIHGTKVAPVVLPATLKAAKVNVAYSQQLFADGSNGAPSYAVTSGTLPDGITLSPSGLLSGTPTTAGTYKFIVTDTDTAAPADTSTKSYTLNVKS